MNKKIMSNLIAAGVISSAVLLAGCDLDFGGSGSSNNGGTTVDTVVDFDSLESSAVEVGVTAGTGDAVVLDNTDAVTVANNEGESVSLTLPATTELLDASGAIAGVTAVSSSVALSQDITKVNTGGVSVANVVDEQAAADSANEYSSLGVANFSVIAKTASGDVDVQELSEPAAVAIQIEDDSLAGTSPSEVQVYAYLPAGTEFKAIGSNWVWVLITLPEDAISIVGNRLVINFSTRLPVLFNIVKKKAKATGSTGSNATGN